MKRVTALVLVVCLLSGCSALPLEDPSERAGSIEATVVSNSPDMVSPSNYSQVKHEKYREAIEMAIQRNQFGSPSELVIIPYTNAEREVVLEEYDSHGSANNAIYIVYQGEIVKVQVTVYD